MTDEIRFGIVGTGMMGIEHILDLQAIEGNVITALCDPNENSIKAAKELTGGEVESFTNHQELLKKGKVDALIVATPNMTHTEILLDIIEAKIPVMIEKPLCTTTSDCAKVISAAGNDAMVWVGLEYRYMPAVAELIERVNEGIVGTVRMVSIREHRFPFLKKVENWNRFNVNTGGTMVEKCCHFFDLMNLITGDLPVRVMASGGQDVNHLDEEYNGTTPDILDNAYVIVEFESGSRGMLDLCMFAEATKNQEEVSVVGDLGKLEALVPESVMRQGIRGKHWIGSVEETHSENPEILNAGTHNGSSYVEHLRFRKALLEGSEPEVGLIEGFWSVAVGEAAHLSFERKSTVEIDEVIEGTGISR